MAVEGIDVSKWQQKMDWQIARDAGVRFTFVRASVGLDKDERVEINLMGAKEVGISRSTYHAFRANLDPVEQAEFFWAVTRNAYTFNSGVDLPLAIDVEQDIHVDDYAGRLDLFATHLEHISKWRPIIYTRQNLWNNRIGGDWARIYDLWVADWNGGVGKPRLPKTWNTWYIWQYTIGDGAKYGSSARLVPVDRFNGSYVDFWVWSFMHRLRRWLRSH